VKRLALLGASGHGKVVADMAELCGWDEIVFFDDAWPDLRRNGHWDVVGDSEHLLTRLTEFQGIFVAIGNNSTRFEKLNWLKKHNASLVTLVHPSSVISRYATIAQGSVVMAGVVVNADARIGEGAILNTGCSIDHDCVLGNCVHMSPGAQLAGGVKVGDFSWVGIGAAVRQLITIGENSVVGAGAAVVKDVPDGVTVVGVPAK
jgi:sugar O-acyltransferase (sialic acid O-acetyltransferase NeuD family)